MLSEKHLKMLTSLLDDVDTLSSEDYNFYINLMRSNKPLTKEQELRIIKDYDEVFGYGYEGSNV